MYFLNLSLLEFLTILGAVSAVAVALYLLDRARRRLIVSTLRFWEAADEPIAVERKRHIQQPWSLLLQLVSMALLMLAIAQLRIGSQTTAGRDHVMVLDTSAWMGARSGRGTLMDAARQRARQYLRAVPSGDRVMLVRADALVTPATAFEPDHKRVEGAIEASEAGATALNLDQALAFARHIQMEEGRRAGEIAFIGAGRVAESASLAPPRNLRMIPVSDSVENCGLRKIGVRPSNGDRDIWEIYVSAHNYGNRPRSLTLALDFGPLRGGAHTAIGSKPLKIAPGADAEATFQYRAGSGGILGATLTPHDAFARDDHAELELPAQPSLSVTVYSNQPELLQPVLASMPRVTAVYRKPEEYQAGDTGLVILDRFIPGSRPAGDSIWIDPPAQGSPIPIGSVATDVPFAGWDSEGGFAEGLRAKDFKLEKASVFQAAPGDMRVGEVAAGPVIVARGASSPGQPKVVVFGFHPVLSGMRYELATPLLFANLLRWISPEMFLRSEMSVGSVGAVKVDLDPQQAPPGAAAVKITAEDGSPVPFTLHERTLNFFAGSPGLVRVAAGDREYRYSLTLPQLGVQRWVAPAGVRQGMPHFAQVFDRSTDVWPWLAMAAALGLLLEWVFFGNPRAARRRSGKPHYTLGLHLLRRRRVGAPSR
jgi:hypothetical protein